METLLFGLFGASLAANAALLVLLSRAKKAPAPTFGAEALLHDLTRGPALIRVERVDTSNILLRSPKA